MACVPGSASGVTQACRAHQCQWGKPGAACAPAGKVGSRTLRNQSLAAKDTPHAAAQVSPFAAKAALSGVCKTSGMEVVFGGILPATAQAGQHRALVHEAVADAADRKGADAAGRGPS